jgi:hypothetical protein
VPAIGGLAAIGLGLFVAIVLLQHLLVPSLDPARHQISEYAHGDHAWLMTFAFASWAMACAGTAVLAWRRARSDPRLETRWASISVLTAAAAAGLTLTACFETQTTAGALPPGVERSAEGSIHDLASGAVLIALSLAATVSVSALATAPEARRRVLAVLIVCVAATSVLLLIGDAVSGVRQRVLVAGGCAWQATLLQALLRPR